MAGEHGGLPSFWAERDARRDGDEFGGDRGGLEKYELKGKTPPRGGVSRSAVLPIPVAGIHESDFSTAPSPRRRRSSACSLPGMMTSYVVADVPEAIFSNLGLIYLAHTHVPTIWDAQGIKLAKLEWRRHPDGGLESQRTLPNRVEFGVTIKPEAAAVRMELWLRNGTTQKLSGLRVQNCLMLAARERIRRADERQQGFSRTILRRSRRRRQPLGDHGLVTDPTMLGQREMPLPARGPSASRLRAQETVRAYGWLSFYEGTDIDSELRRIDQMGWRP